MRRRVFFDTDMNWAVVNHLHELLHVAAATLFITTGAFAIWRHRRIHSRLVLSYGAMCSFAAGYAVYVVISHNLPKLGEFWIPWTDFGLVVTFASSFLYLLTVGLFLDVRSRVFRAPLILLGIMALVTLADLLLYAASRRSLMFIPVPREGIGPHQLSLGEGAYSLLLPAEIMPVIFISSFVWGALYLLVHLIRNRSTDILIYIGLSMTAAIIVNESLVALTLYEGVYLLAFTKVFEAIRIHRAISVRSQRQFERQLHEAEKRELERRVQIRTSQLALVNSELEAFAYSISHDLRAPLRHLDGYAGLLESRYRHSLDERGKHYVDTIAGSARHMGELIDDLLQFSRTGQADMHRERINMNQVLRAALTVLKDSFAGRNIDWVIGDLPSVRGDYALLRQVWVNLLENAAKYTEQVKVPRVEIGSREEDEEIVFSVSDNGVGFDMQHASKLFGVFQRLHSQDEFEGTGIGLAIVKRIITRHGGRVWAESRPNEGATFYFSLPKSGPDAGVQGEEP